MSKPKTNLAIASELWRLAGAAEANGEVAASDILRIAAERLTADAESEPPPEAHTIAACRDALAAGLGIVLDQQCAANLAVFLGLSNWDGLQNSLGGTYFSRLPNGVAVFLPTGLFPTKIPFTHYD